jgi:hypothetical protein
VFTSVTGFPTFSVKVGAPLAYEPPATETRAVVVVSDTSWNTGLAAGKAAPVVTLSLAPFTEITAEVGGGSGGAGGVFGGFVVVPDPLEPEDAEVGAGPDAWNGSLLSKSENDCSCPAEAGGCAALISWVETELVAELVTPGIAAPASEGAAGSGAAVVAAGAGAALAAVVSVATWGFEAEPPPPIAIIVCAA